MKKTKWKLLATCFAALLMCLSAMLFVTGCRQPTESGSNTNDINDNDLDDLNKDDPNKQPPNKTVTNGGAGSGTLVSVGPAAAGATTYYIDAENGNDNWNGTSPLSPWKSFKNANAKTFQPGDHILLEADSIWNGNSISTTNLSTLLESNKVGMLFPKGNGAEGKHIVIDLYDLDNWDVASPTVYYSANHRPVINGNGTPAPGSNRWFPSGAITLQQQHHWKIRNIECTNSFDVPSIASNPSLRDTHWYKAGVAKHLCGIFVMGFDDTRTNPDYRGIVNPADPETYNLIIENCYVHDVQSMHTNNGGGGGFNNSAALGGVPDINFKVVGGIIVYGMAYNASGVSIPSASRYFGYNGLLLQGNIVKRVALEGLRNKSEPDGSGYANSNVVFRGNYLESIAGDGIVLDGVQRNTATNARADDKNGLVESNVVKDACAAPNFLSANYAAVWAMTCYDSTFQYNEAYGDVYGWNDGEAWDIDNGSDKVVYQYNYSHHNSGGCILFMSSITNGVFRYNISANDGGSTKYMATVTTGVNTSSNSYATWNNGQCLFHYTNENTASNTNKPLIYNNTFYIGDGITCGVFGHNTTTAINKYVRFYNNILLKEGTGTVYLSYGQQGDGIAGYIYNPAGFKNNLLWADGTAAGDKNKFNNGSRGLSNVLDVNGNVWADPGLKISANATELRNQRDTALSDSAYTNPTELSAFTSKSRLRNRASLFTPVTLTSPVIGAGMEIPNGGGTAVDGAWDSSRLTEDMFGTTITATTPPIGAAVAPYTSTP